MPSKLIYGQTEFDEKVMIEKFRKHNAEVKEYFADRDTFEKNSNDAIYGND
jgi:hypothetical protein